MCHAYPSKLRWAISSFPCLLVQKTCVFISYMFEKLTYSGELIQVTLPGFP